MIFLTVITQSNSFSTALTRGRKNEDEEALNLLKAKTFPVLIIGKVFHFL